MTQKRIWDYGDPVVSPEDNETRQYFLDAGVYSGFGLSVDASNDLEIALGWGLMPDGVMWAEDAEFSLSFTAPGAATNYTVVATHVDQQMTEGVPVEYAITSGLSATVADGVVLGWIYHPGAGVPLDATHLVAAPKQLTVPQTAVDTAPVELFVPLRGTWSDVAGMGGNVTFVGQSHDTLEFDAVNFVVHQKVSKVAGPAVAETLVQHVQFFVGAEGRPVGFDFYVDIPGGADLQLQLRDTDLNIVTISGSPISTTAGWELQSITVDRTDGVFAAGAPYELRLTSSVDLNQEISLAYIVARYYPYPA
ncbi:hypothetical protein LCGC14_1626500 [marine sediment metagenome]|uniref:Uncharacterized protein n=1 Tax=marine sediment metagenome TaxID=412755 RepID=A0A0F9IQX2_9ZZZZ